MSSSHRASRQSVSVLTLGAIGVVYGDIGTSPLYAFREALAQSAEGGIDRLEIIGVLSLALWALILVVTLKYVFFLTRMDNQGEGGVLSLTALAHRATSGKWLIVTLLGSAGQDCHSLADLDLSHQSLGQLEIELHGAAVFNHHWSGHAVE